MSSSRLKAVLVLVLSGGSLYLGVLNMVDRSLWQQASDGVEWKESHRGVEVASSEAQFLARESSTLHTGDLLIGINGIPVKNLADLLAVQELLSQELPESSSVTYLVQHRDGTEESVFISFVPTTRFTHTDILLAIVAGGFLLSGLFIFVRGWNIEGSFHFFLFSLMVFVLLFYRHSGRADLFDLSIFWIDVTIFLFLPPLFVHYCCRFPRSLEWLSRRPFVAILFYIPGTFLLLVFALWFSRWLSILGFPRTQHLLIFFDKLHLIHFAALLAFGACILVLRRHGLDALERQQLKWIALGTLGAIVPLLIGYAIPVLAGRSIQPWMEASVLSLLFIPVTFVYGITRYRLMDVDLFFKQSMAYLLSSSALVVLYVGLTLLIGRAAEGIAGESKFVIFASVALFVAFLFAPLRNRVQEQIDRYFYKDRYDYRQSFTDFGRALGSNVNLPILVKKLSQRLYSTLDVTPVKVFLTCFESTSSPYSFQLFNVDSKDRSNAPLLKLNHQLLLRLDFAADALFRQKENFPTEAVEIIESLGLRYLLPLRNGDRVIGLLCFGSRRDGRLLDSADLYLLRTLSDYAAIAIDNALLYQSLELTASELNELKSYYENVVESITAGICVVQPEGRITTWNSALEKLYGMTAKQTIGRNIQTIFPSDFIQTLRRFTTDNSWIVRKTTRLTKINLDCVNEEARLVSLTAAPFVSSRNTDTGTLLIIDDVTRKAQLENQLLQAEKLSSIGLFAAGVAHEVNTPLAGISSYTQMLLEETNKGAPQRKLLKKIENQSFRASEIVNNLLNFARIRDTDFQEVNINLLMLETLTLLDHSLKHTGIEVKLDLDQGLPTTLGNGGRLQQVFMNLFLNARDAMPKGGKIEILSALRDSHLIIEIRDSGAGISEDTIKQIYDPFFTTKAIGKGNGLGLSVSYGIIQEHSGRIMVESREGYGSTFTIQLPLKRLN